MKARDIISPRVASLGTLPQKNVSAEMPLADILPRLLDTADHRLGVNDGQTMLGVIDSESMLEGLGRLIAPRDDTSTIMVATSPSAYSASQIAVAVEDADVHLVDLWTNPGEGDILNVTLRVRTTDPSGVVASLERHGFDVVDVSAMEDRNMDIAVERLLSLNTLLNV